MSGEFESYGGRHVPEPLEEPLAQLADAFEEIVPTEDFQTEFQHYLAHFGWVTPTDFVAEVRFPEKGLKQVTTVAPTEPLFVAEDRFPNKGLKLVGQRYEAEFAVRLQGIDFLRGD